MTFLAQSLCFVGSECRGGFQLLLKMIQNSTLEIPHDAAGVADPRQVWGDVLPNADAALADALSGCQLHKEQRNADNQQKKNIQQHEGPWREKNGILQHMKHIQAISFFFPSHAFVTLHFLLWNTFFSVVCLFTSSPFWLDAHRLHFGGRGTGISTRSRDPRWIPPEPVHTGLSSPTPAGRRTSRLHLGRERRPAEFQSSPHQARLCPPNRPGEASHSRDTKHTKFSSNICPAAEVNAAQLPWLPRHSYFRSSSEWEKMMW